MRSTSRGSGPRSEVVTANRHQHGTVASSKESGVKAPQVVGPADAPADDTQARVSLDVVPRSEALADALLAAVEQLPPRQREMVARHFNLLQERATIQAAMALDDEGFTLLFRKTIDALHKVVKRFRGD